MDDNSKLENMAPLGRSVEEVEAENGNLVNPPAHDEGHAGRAGNVVAPLPIVNPSAQGVQGTIAGAGAPIIGAYSAVESIQDFADRDRVNEKRTNDDPSDNSQA